MESSTRDVPWGFPRPLSKPACNANAPVQLAELPTLQLSSPIPRSAFVVVPQFEEQAMLPDTDDQTDHRQWTQQHLDAADLRMAPTPPQGEIDADCMDVNVRGPGKALCLLFLARLRSSLPVDGQSQSSHLHF